MRTVRINKADILCTSFRKTNVFCVFALSSKIPDQGNRAELTLTCLHRNNLGIDEFLGQATLPLKDMDVYDRPRAKWFKLESKPGKEKKNKERGELEVRIAFVVKSGSLTDLSKKDKHKSSIGQLASSVGGSLLSIGQGEKRKSIKKLAGSLSSKLHIRSKKKNVDGDDSGSFSGSFASIGTPSNSSGLGGIGGGSDRKRGQRAGEADPGVISEDEDEFVFDNLSHKSSGSSLNIQRSGLQVPSTLKTTNFTPQNPSPLLGNGNSGGKGKLNGGKPKFQETFDKDPIVAEMEQLELDFSVRARTLPPPSKPPRTQQTQQEIEIENETEKKEVKIELDAEPEPPLKLDEWESKLYGGANFLETGSSDSLKRRSFETRVPLPVTIMEPQPPTLSSSLENYADGDRDEPPKSAPPPLPTLSFEKSNKSENIRSSPGVEMEPENLNSFNDSAETFEQLESTGFFADNALAQTTPHPQEEEPPLVIPVVAASDDEDKKDAYLDVELRLNKNKEDEEKALQQELEIQQEEQRLRDAKRLKEDQSLLSFAKLSVPLDEESKLKPATQEILKDDNIGNNVSNISHNFLTPEQSPKESSNVVSGSDRWEKRLGKFKYGNKRGELLYPRHQKNDKAIMP